jgi:Protein of unknown function (DUF3016)
VKTGRIAAAARHAMVWVAFVALPLHAAVTVSYGDPDRFTDAGDRNTDPRQAMLSLEQHFKKLGDRYLPPHTNLKIQVLDLDRAGRPAGNLPTEIRIITGQADMPCIELAYTLEADGKELQSGHERVCDPGYLSRPLGPPYDEHDPLVYEKRMLEQWFRKKFAKVTPAR